MDFNKLLSKLKDIDPTNVFDPKGVSAAATEAVKPAPAVKLDEAAQLRVLAGRSTILAESELMEKKLTAAEKDKKEEVVKSMKKDKKGFMKRYGEKGEEVMHATATKIAKKKAESVEEGQEDLKKVGDKVKTSKGVMTKTATGLKHERSYEKEKDEDDDAPKAKKAKKESIDKMVEAKKKEKKMAEAVGQEGPADLLAAVEQEINNPGRSIDNLTDVLNATFGSDRSPEFKKARAVIGKYLDLVDNAAMGSEEDGIAPMRGGNISRHIQQYDLTDYLQHAADMLDKAKGPMGESSKPDFLDIDKDGDKKEPMKKAAADKDGDKKDGKKGMSAKQEKYFGKKNESAMMPKGKKRPVKESVEQKLTFVKCLQAVKESNGSLQIDPMDKTLWTWAQRVAAAKAGTGAKADAYAAKVYESYGGEWSLYNTLVEEK